MTASIVLPFPPASLSGHAEGHWRSKSSPTAVWREKACEAAKAANLPPIPAKGDIRVIAAFYPPDRRSDRVNLPNRLKPVWDGLADALKVNDRRFLPSYIFGEPERPGRVVIEVLP